MTGFNNPLVGGGGSLVYPQIKSPNFSQAGGTGWAILKNGQAFFYSLTLQGGNVVLFGSNGEILIYSSTPAAGNLVIAIAGAAGVDSFGNTWSAGEQIGIAGQGQLVFQPNVGQSVKIGGSTATVQASMTGNTTDVNQGQGSLYAPVLINPGTSQIMGTVMTSPMLATGGMGIVMQSAADDASVAAKISLCSVSISGGTATFTSIIDVAPNSITFHATTGASQTIVLLTSGTSYTTPANMPATILCECFGASGGGGGGGGDFNGTTTGAGGGGGSGGGEYAAEPALAVSSTTGYTIAVGTAGSAGSAGLNTSNGGNGGAASGVTKFIGNSVTVIANPGQPGSGGSGSTGSSNPGGNGGAGGTGSANTTHFNGGAGGVGAAGFANGTGGGGGGGGSSAGTTATGNNGSSSNSTLGANGGSAPVGGQAGGAGGSSATPTAGTVGGIPGGGSGGGGGGSGVAGAAGAAGTRGLIRLTFTQTTSTAQTVTVSITGNGNLQYTNTANTTLQVGKNITYTTGTQQFTLASAVAITGLSVALGAGTYLIRSRYFYVGSGSIGSTHVSALSFTGTITPSGMQVFHLQRTTGTTVGISMTSTASWPPSDTSPTHISGQGFCEFQGYFTVTVSGTLTETITLTTPGDDITTQPGSYMEVIPVT